MIILIILNIRVTEISKELDNQKLEQQKSSERFKIYERLSKIESEVFKK